MSEIYNMIMHHDPEFWSGGDGCVVFPKSRFLEHTEEHLVSQFQSLDSNTINKLKELPTLFAVEHEKTPTRIGRITGIEVEYRNLRIYYKFNKKHSTLISGLLISPELKLNVEGFELYRTHWALKEANLNEFLKKMPRTLDDVFEQINEELDESNPQRPNQTKFSVLYAHNGSGKTRLSKLFADNYNNQVLFYNAFTEDCFRWDNEKSVLEISKDTWIVKIIQEQGLDGKIIENFQKLTGSRLEPRFAPVEKITSSFFDESTPPMYKFSFLNLEKTLFKSKTEEPIKISRGEESIFIWSIFYSILEAAIDTLNESIDDLRTSFDNIQYIVIDDPVSSMDDSRIITVALELVKLIKKSSRKLRILVTTHHALFFNILFHANYKKWGKKNYILSKSGTGFSLKKQGNDSPFTYHHVLISEIEKTIADSNIKKYHFNIFRTLLEKTANFLGYDHWKKCLQGNENSQAFIKTIDHYSHDRLSDSTYWDITDNEKKEFSDSFVFFIKKYDFMRGKKINDQTN